MQFTPSQQQAIDVTRRGVDACVVAGPGSGKTTVLVEYFRRLVESGTDPLRILAITFTEKAACNMRAKLAKAFATDAALRGRLERAYVSTVHGFCARLLRENAIFAGIDPEFYVIDDRESARLQSLAINGAMDEMLARDPAATFALMRSLSSPDCAPAILSVYDAVRAAGECVANLDRYPEPPGPSMEDVCALVDVIRAESTAGWSENQRTHLAGVLACCERICGGDPLAALNCNLNKLKRGSRVCDLIKDLRDVLVEVQRGILTGRMRPMRATLCELLQRFDTTYREAKRQLGGLDFADLEEFSVRLLEGNPEVRARIQSQFDQVLMDEYQDTNGQQARLVELVRPPDRFYAVGDINQSIYGFRHANPEVFRNYRDSIERSGKRLVDLAENFRSRPDILRAVETILNAAPGIEPRALIPAQEFHAKDEPSVEVLIASGEDALEIEPPLVARRIVELQRTLRVGRTNRAAEFRDFAVLVRNSEVLSSFTAAFDEAGIPYLVNRGKGFYETREVVDLVQLLRVLVNPRDEISLAAVLRSPFVEISDEALLRLKQPGNLAASLRRLGDEQAGAYDPADWEKLRRFQLQLARWRAAIGYKAFDRLLLEAIEETGYPWDAGPRSAGNIEKFLAQARDAGNRQTLAEFVEDLQLIRASNPREPEAPPEDSVNAVQVMTVHSAKGLEYPVVFVAALQKGTDTSLGTVSFSPRIGLGACWRNEATLKSVDDRYQDAIKQERRERDEQESSRLLYVAMTRAEEHLVLSLAATKNAPKNWDGVLAGTLGLDLETPRQEVLTFSSPAGERWRLRVHCTDAPPEILPRPELARTAAEVGYLPLLEVSAQYDSNANVTSINAFANCPRRYYLSYYLGLVEGRPAAPRNGDAPARSTAEFGREVHALLAGEDVAAPEPQALELAARFPASELGCQAAAAPRVEREFDFLLAVDDLVLRGQIDLWYEANGELVLVDYKTDRITAAEAPTRAEGYAVQLRLYALALQRLTGRTPARAFLYFLRPDVAVPVEITPALLDEAEQVVRDFRDAQSTLAFPLREGPHCRACPHARSNCPAPTGAA